MLLLFNEGGVPNSVDNVMKLADKEVSALEGIQLRVFRLKIIVNIAKMFRVDLGDIWIIISVSKNVYRIVSSMANWRY